MLCRIFGYWHVGFEDEWSSVGIYTSAVFVFCFEQQLSYYLCALSGGWGFILSTATQQSRSVVLKFVIIDIVFR